MVVLLQTSPNRFLRVETNSLMNFFGKIFFFGFWLKRLLTFGKNFTEKLSKLISTCSENQLTKQIFSIFLLFLIQTRTSGEIFSDFWQKKFPVNLSKLLSTRSRSTVGWKIFFENFFFVWFPNFERSCFWLSAKFLKRGRPNWFVRVQKTFWRCALFQFFVFSPYWIVTKCFLTFDTNFCVKLSKPLSPCFNDLSDGIFFRKVLLHFIFGL